MITSNRGPSFSVIGDSIFIFFSRIEIRWLNDRQIITIIDNIIFYGGDNDNDQRRHKKVNRIWPTWKSIRFLSMNLDDSGRRETRENKNKNSWRNLSPAEHTRSQPSIASASTVAKTLPSAVHLQWPSARARTHWNHYFFSNPDINLMRSLHSRSVALSADVKYLR